MADMGIVHFVRRAGRSRAIDRHSTISRWTASLLNFIVPIMLVSAGCTTHRPNATGVRAVERLDLLLTSMALDLDGQPGADGFGARVYASNRRSAQGAVLSEGRLEIVIYDGVVRAEDFAKTEPLRTWSFPATELKAHLQKTSIGIGYRFALAWGEAKPGAERITVVARYVAPDGVSVQSAPGTIPLAVK